MRKASYAHALVVLSACGSGGHGQPMLLDAGDVADAGSTGDTMDAGFARCSKVTFSTTTPPSYPTGLGPNSLAASDVNRDGKLDIVAANGDAGTISVLLGNGNGTFKPKADVSTGLGATAITVVDVNKDGIPDLIVVNKGSSTVSVLLGGSNGAFQAKPNLATDRLSVAIAAGDVNRDGKLDLVVAGGGDLDGGATVFTGNGDGTFQASTDVAMGGFPGALALADVNKDGKLDIVVTSGSLSVVSVLLGNGNGTFQTGVDNPLGGIDAVASAAAVVDVSGDGKLDIVVADTETNRAVVLLGNGDGTFQGEVDFPVGPTPQGLAVADVTGDGKLDIVTVGLDAKAISVLAGKGDGTFQDKVDTPVGSLPVALAVTDINGDSVPDILVADQGPSSVITLRGQCQP